MTARPLRSVPAAAPKTLGLVRVSKERDGMASPEIQWNAIATYIVSRGYDLVDSVEGIDESGSRDRSAWWPTLERAVAAVEAGQYDVLVVWKFSRVARHRLKWATAISRVEAAGGRIESATEQFDTSTSSGRFARGMVGELNAFFAEQIGEGWKEAHERRVRAGKPANGKPRWGYVYDPVDKLHVPDPVTGPVLAKIYRRYIAGESVYSLVRWLNAHGHRTSTSGLWEDRALRRVMDSGFASGQFTHRGELHPGVHQPLIDPKTWQAYLDARKARRAAPARRERSQYLLSGLVRCARCGRPMVAGQFGDRRQSKYRCKTGKERGPEGCEGGYVMAKFLEGAVRDWLAELAGEADQSHAAAMKSKARRETVGTDVRRLARSVERAEQALARLAVQNAEHPLPAGAYKLAHDDLAEQLEGVQGAYEEALLEQRTVVANPNRVALRLLQHWETWPVAHRRTELAMLLDRLEVTTGRPRARIVGWSTWGECWAPEST